MVAAACEVRPRIRSAPMLRSTLNTRYAPSNHGVADGPPPVVVRLPEGPHDAPRPRGQGPPDLEVPGRRHDHGEEESPRLCLLRRPRRSPVELSGGQALMPVLRPPHSTPTVVTSILSFPRDSSSVWSRRWTPKRPRVATMTCTSVSALT